MLSLYWYLVDMFSLEGLYRQKGCEDCVNCRCEAIAFNSASPYEAVEYDIALTCKVEQSLPTWMDEFQAQTCPRFKEVVDA